MPAAVLFAVYGSAAVVALVLLHLFRGVRWYWHILALLVAFAVGLVPLPESWQSPYRDVIVGAVFLLLFVWGVGFPLFRKHHGALHHAPPHGA